MIVLMLHGNPKPVHAVRRIHLLIELSQIPVSNSLLPGCSNERRVSGIHKRSARQVTGNYSIILITRGRDLDHDV